MNRAGCYLSQRALYRTQLLLAGAVELPNGRYGNMTGVPIDAAGNWCNDGVRVIRLQDRPAGDNA